MIDFYQLRFKPLRDILKKQIYFTNTNQRKTNAFFPRLNQTRQCHTDSRLDRDTDEKALQRAHFFLLRRFVK